MVKSLGDSKLKRVKYGVFSQNMGFFRENGIIIISSAVFVFALILGCFAVSLSADNSCFGISDILKNSLSARHTQSFFVTFGYSILAPLCCILLLFLFGNCSLGWIFIYLVPFVRAFSIGLVSGCLYRLSLNGIGYFTLILLPSYFISSLTVIFASAASYKMSRRYYRLMFSSASNADVSPFVRQYMLNFLIYFLLIVFSALADAVMSACFIKFFNI